MWLKIVLYLLICFQDAKIEIEAIAVVGEIVDHSS